MITLPFYATLCCYWKTCCHIVEEYVHKNRTTYTIKVYVIHNVLGIKPVLFLLDLVQLGEWVKGALRPSNANKLYMDEKSTEIGEVN